jgi:probable rRNA maturation factor
MRRVARSVMQAEGCPQNAQVSIFFCANQRIRTLNKTWRGIDAPTDVLSFPQEAPAKAGINADRGKARKSPPVLLGDVVISVETAARQAKSTGKSLAEEVNFLLVHGLLHLLGWDDATAVQRRRMLKRQEEILGRIKTK